jgi:membrane protease YdiL (CAAX protease family)
MQRRHHSTGLVCLCAAIVIVPLVAAQWTLPPMPWLARQSILCAWGVGATLFLERVFFSESVLTAWRAVGFARARARVAAIGLLVSVPMWLLLPVLCGLNGIPITVRQDWPAIVLGVILVNGITEEVLHRGFVFHRLRRQFAFARAAAIGAAVFAAQHLYLVATVGWAAGISSVVLAALLTWPLAYVFERGGNSIATPAILHTSSNAPMLILEAPDGGLTAVLVPYMAGVLGSIYLVFLFRRLLRA